MTTLFNMIRDINGYNGFGLQPSQDKFGCTLLASTPQSFTVPSNYADWICMFMLEPGDSVWIGYNVSPTIPSGSMASLNCELNPTAWKVKAGDVIYFNTLDTSDNVGAKLYALI